MTQPCLARLCDWKQTHEVFAPRFKCAYLHLCNGSRVKGEAVCEDCLKRPKACLTDIKSNKYIYGLITDPLPDTAKVYGSTFYNKMLEIIEASPSSAWLVRAKLAAKMMEQRAARALSSAKAEEGETPLLKLESGEYTMPPKKKVVAPTAPLPKAQTLMRTFTPIRTLYLESPEQPKVLMTESQGIWKEEIAGEQCWISESGHVFLNEDGIVGEFLGFMKDGEFVPLE